MTRKDLNGLLNLAQNEYDKWLGARYSGNPNLESLSLQNIKKAKTDLELVHEKIKEFKPICNHNRINRRERCLDCGCNVNPKRK